ncbi:MAG TPA: response regulator transcription factor [Actinomycetota bacterium]|nr:response regulator transcription factor [Actinomycetota bacterium]
MSEQGVIKVLVVDDHQMFAQTLIRVFRDQSDLEVVGAAATAADARHMAARFHPDVVLMDNQLPDGAGIDAAADIRAECPATKVVILTAYADDNALVHAIEVGCSGFISKVGLVEDALSAVRAAAVGETLIPPELLMRLLPRLRREHQQVSYGLTDRELEVLELMARGLHNAAIAEALFLSVNTVRKHVQAILTKLEAHSKLEAAAIAVRQGILQMTEDGPKVMRKRHR